MGPYPPRVRRNHDVGPRGLAARRIYEPQPISQWGWGVSTLYGKISAWGSTAYVPGLLEL